MSYFSKKSIVNFKHHNFFLRRHREHVSWFYSALIVKAGDVLEVFFSNKGCGYSFEGICLAIRHKSFTNANASITLRNMIQNVGIQCVFSYYYNRIYYVVIKDYKRKLKTYSKSKFFFFIMN